MHCVDAGAGLAFKNVESEFFATPDGEEFWEFYDYIWFHCQPTQHKNDNRSYDAIEVNTLALRTQPSSWANWAHRSPSFSLWTCSQVGRL